MSARPPEGVELGRAARSGRGITSDAVVIVWATPASLGEVSDFYLSRFGAQYNLRDQDPGRTLRLDGAEPPIGLSVYIGFRPRLDRSVRQDVELDAPPAGANTIITVTASI